MGVSVTRRVVVAIIRESGISNHDIIVVVVISDGAALEAWKALSGKHACRTQLGATAPTGN